MSYELSMRAKKFLYNIYKVISPTLEQLEISTQYHGCLERLGDTVTTVKGCPLIIDQKMPLENFGQTEELMLLSLIFYELSKTRRPEALVIQVEIKDDKAFAIFGGG